VGLLEQAAKKAVNPAGEQVAYRDCMTCLDGAISHFKEFKLEGINQLQVLRDRFLREYLRLKEGGSADLPGH
jgi:hypothetical protein